MATDVERHDLRRRWPVEVGIRLAAIVIVAVFVAANYLVLHNSVVKADRFVADAEYTLVRNEFSHQVEQVVQFQSQISFRDRTFKEVEHGMPGKSYLREQVRDWMWSEFGFSWVIFTTPNQKDVLGLQRGETAVDRDTRDRLLWVSDLVTRAEQKYRAALRPTPGGLQVQMATKDRDLLVQSVPDIYVTGLRIIDGTMAMVVVQAIVPRSLYIPTWRMEPTLLVTIKPVSAKMLARTAKLLGVTDLHFAPLVVSEPGELSTRIGSDDNNPMVAAWKPNMPGTFVWQSALPQIGGLILLFGALMSFVTCRFSALFGALKESEAQNAFLARHDRLTGLMNRAGFDEIVREAIRQNTRIPFAILSIDLDRFKPVNDRFGHAAGDAVLKSISDRFRDRVGKKGQVARLGGDEFAVLVQGAHDIAALVALAENLVRDAQMPIAHEGQILMIGSSVGIAQYPENGRTVHEVMVKADAALYAAKNGGRNRACHAAELEQAA